MTGFVLGVTGFYLVLPSFTDFHAQTHRRATIASALEELKAIVRKFPAKRQKKKRSLSLQWRRFHWYRVLLLFTEFSVVWRRTDRKGKQNRRGMEQTEKLETNRLCVCFFVFGLVFFLDFVSFFFVCVCSVHFSRTFRAALTFHRRVRVAGVRPRRPHRRGASFRSICR